VTMPKVHVKKGDTVRIIAGKDKGKSGEVLQVLPRDNRVIVEGINVVKTHRSPTREMMQGGIVEQPAPIAASNVLLECASCGETSRTGKRTLADGRKIRYCRKCGENVDR